VTPPRTASPLSAERLYGTWDLVDFVRIVDGESIGHVLGPDPIGRLSYQRDGRVSALLMRRDRPWPADGDFFSTDDARRGAAALGFVGYGGWFELRGDQVVHQVDISLYPEHPGTELVRQVRWQGQRLVLSTEERRTRSGRRMWDELEWRPLAREQPDHRRPGAAVTADTKTFQR
jgi:hypothetical protein